MNATMRFIVWGTIPIGATIGGIIATAVGVTQALWIGSILGCTAFLPVSLGPVRGLREFPSAPADGPLRDADTVDGAAVPEIGDRCDGHGGTGRHPTRWPRPRCPATSRWASRSQARSRASASRQGRSAAIPEASEVSARAPATARTAVASRAVSKTSCHDAQSSASWSSVHDPFGTTRAGHDEGRSESTSIALPGYSRSRRMTGYRSSAAATTKPHPSQNCGVAALVSSMGRVRSGYASTAANPRWASSSQTLRTSARAWPSPRAAARSRCR